MSRATAITAQLMLFTLVSIAIGPQIGFSGPASPASDPAAHRSLLDARKSFITKIVKDLRQEREAVPQSTPRPWQLVHYPSQAGQLAAYVTTDPKDGKKHPAVVWAHGGFGGIGPDDLEKMPDENDQSPHAFAEAGCVVMYPSWRGTNDNPGKPEFFYGEVDDLTAAVHYAGSLGYVDRSRVYVVGHSTGGTLALLDAEASTEIRAAFAFGPTADVSIVARPGGWPIPFDRSRPGEIELRSAIRYAAAIKTPTFCIEGSRSQNGRNFGELQTAAAGAPLRTYIIPHGTHFNILHSLTALLVAKIEVDAGPACNITIDQKELDDAFNSFLDAQAKARQGPLITVTPAAAARIAELIAAGHKELYLRFELTPDEKIQMRLAPAADPTDTITDSQGVKVALSVDANRSLSPLIIDIDPTTRKLKITHAKEKP